MTQKLGISWGLEGEKRIVCVCVCVWEGERVPGTTRDVISKPCLKRERIYFHPTLNPPFC